VHIQYFWHGNHHHHGHVWCVYTVLASPIHDSQTCFTIMNRRAVILFECRSFFCESYLLGCPEPHIYDVYDRTFGEFPVIKKYVHCKYV